MGQLDNQCTEQDHCWRKEPDQQCKEQDLQSQEQDHRRKEPDHQRKEPEYRLLLFPSSKVEMILSLKQNNKTTGPG